MREKGFFIGEAVKKGWSAFQKNIGFFVLLLLFIMVVMGVVSYFIVPTKAGQGNGSYYFLSQIILFILGVLVQMGWVKVTLAASADEKPQFSHFFQGMKHFFSFIVAMIFYNIIVFVGYILLIFPGVIWGLRYGLYSYFVVDKGYGPIQALKESAKTTYGAKWDFFGLTLVNLVVLLLGFFALVVGLFATIPLVGVAQAWIYRKLLSQTEPEVTSTT